MSELDGTDALVGSRYQHAAHRGLGESVANRCRDRSSAVLVRRHSKLGGSPLVKTAARPVACVIHGPSDRMPGLQVALEQVHAAGISVGARRDSEHSLECALQVKRTLVEDLGQARQRDWFIQMLLDVPANALHGLQLCAARGRFRPATQAGTIACSLRFFGSPVEGHILTAWMLGRARRPAKNSGGRDGKNKFAILSGIACEYRLPPVVIVAWHC